MSQQPYPYGNYPVHPYAASAPGRPGSIKVLAIIGVILGGLSLCGPFALLPYVMKLPGPPNPMIDTIKADPGLMAYMVASTVAHTVLGIVLLVGAIGALSLKQWARTTMLGYAIGAVVLCIVGVVFNVLWLFPAMARATPNVPQKAFMVGGVIGGAMGLAVGLALPICILYFYTRPRVVEAFEHGA